MPKSYDAGADASLEQQQKSAAQFKALMDAHHHHASDTRTTVHRGHKIEIKTTYEVKVDGKKVPLMFAPDHDGSIHYHPIPNQGFSSAVDLVKCILDNFPDDFPKKGKVARGKKPVKTSGHDHPPHH